jgi:tight adherence protein B
MTSRRARRLALAASWAVLLVSLTAGLSGEARADGAAPQLSLRAVDSTDPSHTKLTIHWSGEPSKMADLQVTEEAKSVDAVKPTSLDDAGFHNDIAFVIDTSDSASASGLVAEAKKDVVAMANTIHSSDPHARFALIGAGARDEMQVNLTDDPKAIATGTLSLSVGSDGAVWDGVARAARVLGTTDRHDVRNIVLITDGQVDSSTVKAKAALDDKTRALGDVNNAGVQVHTVGLGDIGPLQQLATDTGGTNLNATGVDQAAGLTTQLVPGITGYYVSGYTSNVDQGVADVSLTVDGMSTHNAFVVGSLANRQSDLAAVKSTSNSTGVVALQGRIGKLLAIFLAAAACVMAAAGAFMLVTHDSGRLDSMLSVYDDSYNAGGGDDAGQRSQVVLVQRAVAVTEQLAARQGGLLVKYEEKLERADTPLRPAEYLLMSAFATVVAMLLVLFTTRNLLFTVLVVPLGLVLPGAGLNFKGSRRRKKFEALLPDMLQLLAGTLKAGYSMMQGVEAVATEVAEPMGKELRRVMTEARLGRPLEESLDAVAERMGSKDFGWAVMAIRIQREVGGNLSELLMTVGTTMVQRERLRRDVQSLTAEGRVSAYMLGLMPPGVMVAMYMINRKYMMPLFTTVTGNVLLGVGFVMMVGGFLWMNKLVKVEV